MAKRWQENLMNDFGGGSESNPRVVDVQETQKVTEPNLVEIPDGYEVVERDNGEFSIVPVKQESGPLALFAASLQTKTLSAGFGAIQTRVANSLNLLPNEQQMIDRLDRIPKKGWKSWMAAIEPGNVVATKVWGGKIALEKRQTLQKNKLASELDQIMEESRNNAGDPSVLYSIAMSALGADAETVFNLSEAGHYRSGERQEKERILASEVATDSRVEKDPKLLPKVVGERVNDMVDDAVLELGHRLVLINERFKLARVLREPTRVLPDCKNGISLVKVGFGEQFLASLFGAKGLNWANFGGGQEIFMAPNGQIMLRSGVEVQAVSETAAGLLPSTDIATPSENLKAVVDRRLLLGPINGVIEKFATRDGKDEIISPGTLGIKRSGADERDYMVVSNISRALGGIRRLVDRSKKAMERIGQIDDSIQHASLDDATTREIEIRTVKHTLSSLPRPLEVIDEAENIIKKRELNDQRVLAEAGLRAISEENLQSFAKLDDKNQAKVLAQLAARTGSQELAERAVGILRRKSRKYTV